MFKFVTQSPKQSKKARNNPELPRKSTATRATSAEALFAGLDKHQNKNFVTLKRKKCGIESASHNRGLDQARSSSADTQLYTKALKTNAYLSVSKNVVTVTLEENEPNKNFRGSVTARNVVGDRDQTLRSDDAERSPGREIDLFCSRSAQSLNKDKIAAKTAIFRTNGYHKTLKSVFPKENNKNDTGPGVKARFKQELSHRNGVGFSMTQDYFSDSESDGTWIDQPSPIRLTASPPLNAVKVPATKLHAPQFVGNGWHEGEKNQGRVTIPRENGFLRRHEFSRNGAGNGVYDGEISLQRQASNLFFNSLQKSTQNAKAVPTFTKPVAKRLEPQQPHSYTRKNAGVAGSLPNGVPKLNGGAAPSSGQIFVGGPLFMTEEIADEYYDEAQYDKSAKETISSTEQTSRVYLDRISPHNGPLYRSDFRINLHKDISPEEYVINPDHEQKHTGKNGIMPQQHKTLTNENFIKYNGIIGVEKARTFHAPDNTVHIEKPSTNSHIPASRLKSQGQNRNGTSQKHGEVSKTIRIMSSGMKLGSFLQNKKRGVKGQREHRLSFNHDDDDDATTLTMTTTSDYDKELSSTSSGSDSTECESVDSARRTSLGYSDFAHVPQPGDGYGVSVNEPNFVIRKVERITSHEICSDQLSPEEVQKSNHFAVLQRSISTQSGKLRERLNATADDDSLFQVTPRGSESFLAGDSLTSSVENFEQHFEPCRTTAAELGMPSMRQHSPMSGSPLLPHSRVSQLKAGGSLDRPRRSRTLTRVPATHSPPNRSLRSRSLDRAFRSSFTRAISPARSDVAGMRGRSNSMTRKSIDSLSTGSDSLRRGSVRRTPSVNSLHEEYKPSIDVAASLSALILNPADGGDNDRRTIHDYLKQSSRSSSQDRVDNLKFASRFGSGRLADSLTADQSANSTPWSTLERMAHPTSFHNEDVSDLSRLSVQSTPSRESRVISKSQTANRYPTVELSPRSISSLLPSPRRDVENGGDVITIVDNEGITSRTSISDHDGVRRNSFIEAVSGSIPDTSPSSRSESPHKDDVDDIEGAWNELTIAARESKQYVTPPDVSRHDGRRDKSPTENAPATPLLTPQEEITDEVNVNMTKHPVSRDLAVAVIRRRSTRRGTTLPPKQTKNTRSNGLKINAPRPQPPAAHATQENALLSPQQPIYLNLLHSQQSNDDSIIEVVTVDCRNPRCRKQMYLEDAKTKFKSCHHCYTYYCSQQCRLQHWEKHKLKCVFARANSDCKKVLRMGREEDVIKQAFTRVARTGYLSRGRGCVLVEFSSPTHAERFISEGLLALEALPLYLTVEDIKMKTENGEESGEDDQDKNGLAYTCDSVYNPDKTYVLQVNIAVSEEVISRYDRPYRQRNSRRVVIHAVNAIYKPDQESAGRPSYTAPETLILTPPTTVPEMSSLTSPSGHTHSTSTSSSSAAASPLDSASPSEYGSSKLAKRARQLSFINIQRKLREKGVTLRHQYPEVYRKLCAYVDTGTNFTPVVIYPRDSRSGKNFMCLVMPGSEPQILDWVQAPGLLDDIATG